MKQFLGLAVRLASISAAVVALGGCFPEHSDGEANGDTGALEFAVQGDRYDSPRVATGFQVEVEINRIDPQWQACVISKSIPNGSSRIQDCGALNTEPISLIDASCDDNACTITPETNSSGEVALLVTGTRDGLASLHVDVKSTTSSATWGDSFPLTFATATALSVHRQDTEDVKAGFSLMPGASFSWCPSLLDANGDVLVSTPSSITNAASGAAITVDSSANQGDASNCAEFRAAAPGTSSVTFNAQALSHSESITISDPNDIVAAELRPFLDSSTDADAGDGGATIASSPATSIDLTTDDFYGLSYASVLTLKDGSHALGGAGFYKASSEETVSILTNDTDPEMARTSMSVASMGSVIGDGTIDATIGTVKVSLPFHVSEGASQTDGGTN
ncbi:MAG: hypothetical protein ABI183_00930 [Polyangiaceae bacterium]